MRTHKWLLSRPRSIIPLPWIVSSNPIESTCPEHLNIVFRVKLSNWRSIWLTGKPVRESQPALIQPVESHVLGRRKSADPERSLSAEIFRKSSGEVIVINIRQNCQRRTSPTTSRFLAASGICFFKSRLNLMIRIVDLSSEDFEASPSEFFPSSFAVSCAGPGLISAWNWAGFMVICLADEFKGTVAVVVVPVAIFVALEFDKTMNIRGKTYSRSPLITDFNTILPIAPVIGLPGSPI